VAKVAILGGGKQHVTLAERLFLKGFEVSLFGFAKYERPLPMQCKRLDQVLDNADIIVIPTPCTVDGVHLNAPYHDTSVPMTDLFILLRPMQVFIASLLPTLTAVP